VVRPFQRVQATKFEADESAEHSVEASGDRQVDGCLGGSDCNWLLALHTHEAAATKEVSRVNVDSKGQRVLMEVSFLGSAEAPGQFGTSSERHESSPLAETS